MSLGAMVASCSVTQYTATRVQNADVVIIRGHKEVAYRNVEITDAQDEFVMFIENGVGRIERAPYRVVIK